MQQDPTKKLTSEVNTTQLFIARHIMNISPGAAACQDYSEVRKRFSENWSFPSIPEGKPVLKLCGTLGAFSCIKK